MEKLYPISEIFTSPQGEGQFAGCMMTFIRLAGCSVGKPYSKERYIKLSHCEFKCEDGDPDLGHGPNCAYAKSMYALPIYTEMCTLYDGRTFECDTDYRVKERLSAEKIAEQIPNDITHVCISGGEPFIHNLDELVKTVHHQRRFIQVHVETSGTIHWNKAMPMLGPVVWITVSPKFGILPEMVVRADEIKLLIDEDFSPAKLIQEIIDHELVYIQPVNYENRVNKKNLKLTLDWQKKYPNWRVSLQLHKALEEFSGDRVR